MFDLNSYQADNNEMFSGTTAEDILKAMQAGLGTGRDYNDTLHTGEGLKVESLDPIVKVLTNRMEHLQTWKLIPKQKIYNTVHEYNQLVKYGSRIGIFNSEGETPQFTDSQYRRKSIVTKFMGVGGQVTHPAMLVKRSDGRDPLAVEVENKTLLLLTELNSKLYSADDSKIDAQFAGILRQHITGINDIYGGMSGVTAETALDNYFNDLSTIDARGYVLSDNHIENAADAAVNGRKGMISHIISNPTVFNDYVNNFHESKRINVGYPGSVVGATMGQSVNDIQTQFGKIKIANDIYWDERPSKVYNQAADSDKSPNPVELDGSTPIAVNTDSKTKFANFNGNYFYAIAAKNKYGESAMQIVNTSAQAVTASQSVDLKFAASSSPYGTEAFVIYRTEKDATPYTTAKFYPIFTVSAAELASGYDGGSAGVVRDRNRIIPNTHSAMVFYNSNEYWEYLQLAPTMRMDFAINAPSRRFSVLNYGALGLYMPGKIIMIHNIGKLTT